MRSMSSKPKAPPAASALRSIPPLEPAERQQAGKQHKHERGEVHQEHAGIGGARVGGDQERGPLAEDKEQGNRQSRRPGMDFCPKPVEQDRDEGEDEGLTHQ